MIIELYCVPELHRSFYARPDKLSHIISVRILSNSSLIRPGLHYFSHLNSSLSLSFGVSQESLELFLSFLFILLLVVLSSLTAL